MTTVVAQPPAIRPPAQLLPSLRAAGTPARVTRAGGAAVVSVRFAVRGAARLEARVTPAGSTRSIPLLPGTTLAGVRSTKASASVGRAGTYSFRARVRAAKLIRGRNYLVRIMAVSPGGLRGTVTIRFKA